MTFPFIPADVRTAEASRVRPRRLVRLAVVVLAVAGVMAGLGARTALADTATVQLSLDHSAIPVGGSVTMTATVTNLLGTGSPTGSIAFTNAAGDVSLGSAVLSPTADPNTASAQFTTSGLAASTYSLYAVYSPDFTAWLLGLTDSVLSANQTLTVGSTTTTHDTQVVVTTPSLTVDSTTPVTLTATVSETSGTGTPSGTVSFSDTISGTPVPLGSGPVTLVNGVAELTVSDFAVGAHQIVASYIGAGGDNSSSSQPLLLNSQAPVDSRVQTTTTVVVSPSQIAAGDTATITATITQLNPSQSTAPPGGTVSFSSDSVFGINVNLGSAALGTAPPGMTAASNQAIIQIGGWQTGDYTITASYFGDINDQSSAGALTYSVLPARSNTTITYTGDTSVEFQHSGTFAATITDGSGSPLPGRAVTFTLGAQTCTATSDSNGHASCSFVVDETPGERNVSVSVPEDINTHAANATHNVTVTPHATSISVGFVAGPPATTLTATLPDDNGAPLTSRMVTLALGAETCTAVTDPTGVASCNVADETGPPVLLTASFAGESTYLAAIASKTVTVSMGTTLTYTGVTRGDFDDSAVLSATLVDTRGAPVSGQPLGFSIGAQTCWATTSADGSAFCPITITQPAANYTVGVTFARHGIYLGSGDSSTFTVTPEETALNTTALNGATTTTLTATLSEDGITPIAGRMVTLALDSAPCTAFTDASGAASCTVPTPIDTPTATLSASFAGDMNYLPASDSRVVTLQVPTTLAYTGATTADYHDSATLSATLTDSNDAAIVGEPVTLVMGSQHCESLTNTLGTASCAITVSQPAGTYPVTATFAGENAYLPSSASGSLTVTPEQTSVIAGTSGAVLAGNAVSLKGTLLEDGTTPVAGATVTLSLGLTSCPATTNASGVATCAVAATGSLGPTVSTVTFLGNSNYLPASNWAPALLYAFPSSGAFVVGDLTASGAVTFWGAQWWKANTLSGGTAPSSFKGYAAQVARFGCGSAWATGPGNSTGPDGSLPSYMGVIVAQSVTKSGSTISGNIAHIVVVHTTDGSDASEHDRTYTTYNDTSGRRSDTSHNDSPGHTGTGTVVATIC